MLAILKSLLETAENAAFKEPGNRCLHLRAMETLSHLQCHCQSYVEGNLSFIRIL